MTAYDALFRGVLTRMDAERAHHLGFRAIRAGRGLARTVVRTPSRPVQAMGLSFRNPLGLAAGFDKNAVGIDALAALGFGFVEVGTVTALPQPGNPRPRLFRLPQDHAIVNRMGFNNDGAEVVARRLAARTRRLERRERRHRVDVTYDGRRARPVLGVNIGKSKVVPEDDEAAVLADYAASARLLAPYADYLVVNVSSPNTPGLRALQAV
jgi:dihydroorotate dehydrogenase